MITGESMKKKTDAVVQTEETAVPDVRETLDEQTVYSPAVIETPADVPEVKHMTLDEVIAKYGEENVFVSKYTAEDYGKFFEKLETARTEYKNSAARQSGVQMTRERLKNLLFNNAELVAELGAEYDFLRRMISDMSQELDVLHEQILRSDKEYNELNRKYREAVGDKKE